MSDPARSLRTDGHCWFRNAVSAEDLDRLKPLFDDGHTPGKRLSVADLAEAAWLSLIQAHWPRHRPVRLLAFSKSDTANWALPWHQDRVIALKDRHEVPGFTNWSRKAGTWHAEPPLSMLKRMIFLRIHIDPSTPDNGAMEIAPGSHKAGLIPTAEAAAAADRCGALQTLAEPGDILALSMLTLHRSGASGSDAPRRVLRLDLSDATLPAPLEWAT